MKKYLDVVLIVEGKSDAALLSSLYDCEIVTTNGNEIPANLIDYLNAVSSFKKIIILTDPDEIGEKIRERLKTKLNKYDEVKVDLSRCDKNNKHGVAECEISTLFKNLDKYISTNSKKQHLSESELYCLINNLGINKYYIMKKCHTGQCNNKTLLKRLNSLRYSKEKIIQTTQHGN